MDKPIIEILDPVHCRADKRARELILPCLAYEDTMWRKSRYGGKEIKSTSHLITGRRETRGTFLTGLLPRVKKYCKKENIKIKIVGRSNIDKIPAEKKPKLKGIVFRQDQKKILRKVKKKYRGNIVATTGSGKTIIANGIFSMFPNNNILFLCHTTDLIFQTEKSIKKYLPKRKVFVMGGGLTTHWKQVQRKTGGVILISTIQTFSKLDPKKYSDFFDITIVDEVHHVAKKGSQYSKVMELNLSPRRYGLTATIPKKEKEVLVNEGFLGPIIGELTMKEGIAKGINAKPIINLVSVPYNAQIASDCGKKYKLYYQLGIVENKQRNDLIFKNAKKSIDKGEVVLIIIEKTMHGKILKRLFRKNGYKVPFVYGATSKEKRESVKNKLKKKKTTCAICSRIWREGTNIPALNHIINAHGMKEEKIIIQAMGRGLRITKDKTHIMLTDFLDPYKFLAEHAIRRIQIYVDQEWL